jgi:hypothetical protein
LSLATILIVALQESAPFASTSPDDRERLHLSDQLESDRLRDGIEVPGLSAEPCDRHGWRSAPPRGVDLDGDDALLRDRSHRIDLISGRRYMPGLAAVCALSH